MIKKKNLKDEINDLYKKGFIPLFTMNNLKELMNYKNDGIRKERLKSLQSVEYFYKIKNLNGPPSSLNLMILEFEYVLGNSVDKIDQEALTKYINEHIEIVSGFDLLGDLHLHTQLLSTHTQNNEEGLFFASVPPQLHNEDRSLLNISLRDLTIDKNAATKYKDQKEIIKENMRLKGDKKKQHLSNKIDELLDSTFNEIYKNIDNNKLDFFAKITNLETNEISLDMSYKELLVRMELYQKLKIIASMMNLDYKILTNINTNIIPTIMLDKEFQNEYQLELIKDKPRRAESSIFQDRYLSYFSIYWKVIVDSRTGIVLKKIKNKLPFKLDYSVNNI
ncbi:MAG: hypothetical protein OCD02_17190 [Spirochaetaceae bacterium]